MRDSDEILIEYIKLSPNREKIFYSINRKKSIKPSEISIVTGIHLNNVSRSLKQLCEKDLIYILNPDAKRGRLYKLTIRGDEIKKLMGEKTIEEIEKEVLEKEIIAEELKEYSKMRKNNLKKEILKEKIRKEMKDKELSKLFNNLNA